MSRKFLRYVLLIALAAVSAPLPSRAQFTFPVNNWQQASSGPTCGGYAGPGDLDTHWTHWKGLRAFSAADCGNPLINVFRADAGTGTCNGVAGQTTCDIKSVASTGLFDLAALAAFCSGSSCLSQTIYDRVGGVNSGNQGVTAQSGAVSTSSAVCGAGIPVCLVGSATTKMVWDANITIANGSVVYFAAKQTGTTGGNREVVVGQNEFNSSAGWGTTDHADCLEGGSGEIVGTVALGTYVRAFCTLNGASSALLENGTNHTGSLTNGSSAQSGFDVNAAISGATDIWLEDGINSTTMSGTLSATDSNVSTAWGI
jgi:hypothetical protein